MKIAKALKKLVYYRKGLICYWNTFVDSARKSPKIKKEFPNLAAMEVPQIGQPLTVSTIPFLVDGAMSIQQMASKLKSLDEFMDELKKITEQVIHLSAET